MEELREKLEQLAEQMIAVKDAMDNQNSGLDLEYEIEELKEELLQTSEVLEYLYI